MVCNPPISLASVFYQRKGPAPDAQGFYAFQINPIGVGSVNQGQQLVERFFCIAIEHACVFLEK